MLVSAGQVGDRSLPKLVSLRVPRKFSGVQMREAGYRTRPLVFYTLAAIAAAITNAEAVVIGENGQGAFGPACLPFADEWWFRSAHPAFVKRWADFLGLVLEKPIPLSSRNSGGPKGEVLFELRERGFMAGWQQTSSCATRPKDRYGHHGCGICGGCLLRTVSIQAAGLCAPTGDNAWDVYASEDITYDRTGRERRMTPSERAVAVRAVAAMAEFARLADLPDGLLVIDREAGSVDPKNPEAARGKLLRLLHWHRIRMGSIYEFSAEPIVGPRDRRPAMTSSNLAAADLGERLRAAR